MWGTIATWQFSLQAVQTAAEILSAGGKAIDAAEHGIWTVESDPTVDCVGRGGYLNENGDLELDAAIMDGNTLRSGAVAAVRGFEHPVSIARAVLERTNHSIIVGTGAEQFARKIGLPEATRERLVTEEAERIWRERQAQGHDTIGLIALDVRGAMIAATSTSGASMKLPGRVGDTPIVGSGFYAESSVGGAAATGLGEHIMRTCCSFRCVELMRAGMHPQAAVEAVVLNAHQAILRRGDKPNCIAMVCMNARGEYGGAANHKGFGYAVAREGNAPEVIAVEPIVDKDA